VQRIGPQHTIFALRRSGSSPAFHKQMIGSELLNFGNEGSAPEKVRHARTSVHRWPFSGGLKI
jgi:hypothetical protein